MTTQSEPLSRVVLSDRGLAWVRPVAQGDQYELQRAFALLSDLSRYRRFMTGTPQLSDRLARYFTHVDHRNHEALVALPSQHSSSIIGVARYVRHRDRPTEADLAVTVADRWHGLGLATALVRMLSDRAREAGVARFTVDMLADNTAVRALVASAGGVVDEQDGATLSGRIELVPATVSLSVGSVLRAAATGRVVNVPAPLGSELSGLPPVVRAVVLLGG